MTGTTHLAAGAFAGALAGAALGVPPGAAAAAGAVAALLPDIDCPESTVGRRVPVVPALLSALVGHRTVTHTVWFCLFAAAGTGFLGSWLAGYLGLHLHAKGLLLALPALAGALSHLALDACTHSGVEPFAPLFPWHPRGPVVTGSLIDRLLTLVFAALAAGAAGKIF